MSRVRGIPGLENVDVNWDEAIPEIQWKVDRVKALLLGVSFSDIANTIDTATNGTLSSYYRENGFEYNVQVQLPENRRKTIDQMKDLIVNPGNPESPSPGNPGPTTQNITLGQVATPVYGQGPSMITRMSRQRYIAVTGVPQDRSAGEIQNDMGKALADYKLPTGYYWNWGINQQQQAEEFGGMALAVFLAIALIYMLLASQFESFIYPLAIMFSVPLAITGVILGLFFTGRAFGLTALIGVLMLVGIVVKNGILLVDYTNTLRRAGYKRDDALLTAGPTRLRPILMTASAAIFGMLPIALGIGKGSETQAPMATAVIGGLLTSTFLTLFVVPSVYTVLDDLSRFLRKDKSEDGSFAQVHVSESEGKPND
jgi:HAE1 family hydrophobic/amphiphilic exporter-1